MTEHDDRALSIGCADAVLDLAQRHRAELEVLAKYSPPERVEPFRRLIEEYEAVARAHEPEWVTLRTLQAVTGYSPQWLRAKAAELEPHGLARRRGRHWSIAHEAARDLPRKRVRSEIDLSDMEEAARRLGREE